MVDTKKLLFLAICKSINKLENITLIKYKLKINIYCDLLLYIKSIKQSISFTSCCAKCCLTEISKFIRLGFSGKGKLNTVIYCNSSGVDNLEKSMNDLECFKRTRFIVCYPANKQPALAEETQWLSKNRGKNKIILVVAWEIQILMERI
eukprot:NODE_63_length_26141_cov_1.022656.p23 type:complete len:149 gc:universal NODE_63_length_26141_cov_1.022656:12453-12899(+)